MSKYFGLIVIFMICCTMFGCNKQVKTTVVDNKNQTSNIDKEKMKSEKPQISPEMDKAMKNISNLDAEKLSDINTAQLENNF